MSSITLAIKHYKDDDGVEHIDIDQTLTGGIPGTTEKRTLWWKEGNSSDHLFGHVIGKSRRIKVDELDLEFLKTGWTTDTIEHGVVQSYVESDTPKSGTVWIANQVCGHHRIWHLISLFTRFNRPGESKNLGAREGMSGMSSLLGPKRRTLNSEWYMTTVSVFYQKLSQKLSCLCL